MDASYVQAVHRHAMHSALTETCLCILIREPELRVHVIFITGQIQRIYDTNTPCPSATAGRRFSSGCKYRAATKNSRYKNHKQRMQDLELCSAVERSGRHQLPSPSLRVVCSDHAHLLFNCVFLSLQTAIHGTAEACRLSAKPCSLVHCPADAWMPSEAANIKVYSNGKQCSHRTQSQHKAWISYDVHTYCITTVSRCFGNGLRSRPK